MFGESLTFALAEIWDLWFLVVLSCGWIASGCSVQEDNSGDQDKIEVCPLL